MIVRLFLILLLCSGGVLAQAPDALRGVGIDQKLNAQVPLNLLFRNEDGKVVQLQDYFGKRPVILAPVYYECPMLCTFVLNGLLASLKTLSLNVGAEFDVLTVSFDPNETSALAAAKKKTHVQRYGRANASAGWHFLTGDEASIQQLTQAVGFRYRYDAAAKQYAHASGIMVLTPQGKISRYFYGVEYSPRDLRLSLVEASANKIGSLSDQILLLCYQYDPVKGKYGLVIMNLLRLLAIGTVLALGTFMLVMFRKERQISLKD